MVFECKKCANCCKKYFITLLPFTAKKISKALHISLKKFLQNYTILFLQLFPSSFQENKLIVFNQVIPKKFFKKIQKKLHYSPNYFLVMPMIALKKRKGKCIFLNAKNECKIYSVRPIQCKQFPFISLEEKFLHELYPFCKGLRNEKVKGRFFDEKEYAKVKEYFELIKLNGFKKMWKNYPKKGLILLEKKIIGKIFEKEFFQILNKFA